MDTKELEIKKQALVQEFNQRNQMLIQHQNEVEGLKNLLNQIVGKLQFIDEIMGVKEPKVPEIGKEEKNKKAKIKQQKNVKVENTNKKA